jgi:hypothetical protein
MIQDSETVTRLIQQITKRPIWECLILQSQLLDNWETIKQVVEDELERIGEKKR